MSTTLRPGSFEEWWAQFSDLGIETDEADYAMKSWKIPGQHYYPSLSGHGIIQGRF